MNHKSLRCSHPLQEVDGLGDTALMNDVAEIYQQVRCLKDLQDIGVSPSLASTRFRSGDYTKIKQGIYVETSIWNQWSTRQRCLAHHAAHIKTVPSGVLSHQSAALWLGAPLLTLPHKVHMSFASASVQHRPSVTAHRGRTDVVREARLVVGASVAAPGHTLRDVALSLPRVEALVIGDYFLRQGVISVASARAALAEAGGAALAVGQRLSALADSPAETIARDFIYEWNLPLPQEQFEVFTHYGRVYRADFAWPELGVILEVDGEVKYSGVYGRADDVVQTEHRRHRELEMAGWKVVRTRWKELMSHPATLRQRLWEAGVR